MTDQKIVQKYYRECFCYDSQSYNKIKQSRFRVTDGPGSRDCVDIAAGRTESEAWRNAAIRVRALKAGEQ